MADVEPSRLLSRLEELDALMRGTALDDTLFEELDGTQLHLAHGVAGRLQDRVVAVLTRLTMEMVSRDDRHEGSHGGG